MSRNRIIYILILLVLLVLLIAYWRRSASVSQFTQPEPKPTVAPITSPVAATKSTPGPRPTPARPDLAQAGAPVKNVPDANQINSFLSVFKTPISFYGKVIDEQNNPIDGAAVTLVPIDEIDPNRQNPQYSTSTDRAGLFSISGISGAGLNVEVSKSGYYRLPPSDGHRGSYGSFTYGGVRSESSSVPPTQDNPAVFILRKKGEGAALVHWGRSISTATHGTPQIVSLATGNSVPQGDLSVQCWVDDQRKDARGHYPWHCQVSVLGGGGLVSRQGEFDFEAPAGGYQPSDDITPDQDRWSPQAQRQYFVKTGDDHYARVAVHVIANGDHFVTIETYFNSKSGSRELEPASTAQQ